MRTLALGLTAIAMLGLAGCSSDEAPESQSEDITVGGVELTPWAVDMKKVDEHYGTSSDLLPRTVRPPKMAASACRSQALTPRPGTRLAKREPGWLAAPGHR